MKFITASMKRIQYCFLIIFLCVMGLGCSDLESTNRNKKKTEHELILEYRIKSISEYQSLVHLDVPEKEKIHHVDQYDEKGNLQTATGYLNDGNVDFISTCTYDKDGNLLEKKSTKKGGFFISRDLKSYDTKNRRNQNLHFEDPTDPFLYGNINAFDTLGRLIESYIFWPTGAQAIQSYTFNGMMMVVNEQHAYNGGFQYRWAYKYDKNENQIEAIQYDQDSVVRARSLFAYDRNNQLIEKTDYLEGSVAYHARYTYDAKFLMSTKTEYSTFGRVSATYRYKYEYFDEQ